MTVVDQAMQVLDKWVSTFGTKTYMDNHYDISSCISSGGELSIAPIFGIQQNREEIKRLVEVIVAQPWYDKNCKVLEIGLGHFGSTHVLWRELFSQVTTIEIHGDRINRFAENSFAYHGKWILDDSRSKFVAGSSSDPSSVAKIYKSLGAVDFLFIDGDHRYDNVLTDWLLYAPLVRPGGLIAFDDTLLEHPYCEVGLLINQLEQGFFGKKYKLNHIACSKDIGIAYYTVDHA